MTNIIFKKSATTQELIDREIARALRDTRRGGPSKPPKPPDRSREKEYERERSIRKSRLRNKLCTNCGQGGLMDGFVMCLSCRLLWRTYNSRCRSRKLFSLTGYQVSLNRIGQEGPSIDF